MRTRLPLLPWLALFPPGLARPAPPVAPVAQVAPASQAPDPAAVEAQAARALAAVTAGEPGVEVLQEAAAREAERAAPTPGAYARRARLAGFLPRLTAEYRHEQASNRIVGYQGSGEVDYLRLAPSDTVLLRATWELGALVAAPGELSAAANAQAQAKRRAEAVARVTELFFERRRLRAALLVAPPADAAARVKAELEVDRLGAEINALTGARAAGTAP
jgi:hypothetical protein